MYGLVVAAHCVVLCRRLLVAFISVVTCCTCVPLLHIMPAQTALILVVVLFEQNLLIAIDNAASASPSTAVSAALLLLLHPSPLGA